MKKLLLIASSVSLSAAAVLIACTNGDSDDALTSTLPDSGSAADTGPLSDDAGLTDANEIVEAAPKTSVQITLLLNGAPLGSTRVLFHSFEGTLIDSLTTDAAGKVSRKVEGGEMATIIGPSAPPSRRFTTIVGVKPGDDIVVPWFDKTAERSLNITLPTQEGADGYFAIVGSCLTGSGTSLLLPINDPGCGLGRATVPLVVSSHNGPTFLASIAKKDVDLNSADGGAVDVDLSKAVWSTSMETVNVDFSGTIPAGAGWTFDLVNTGLAYHVAQGTAVGAAVVPGGFAEAYQTTWTVNGLNTTTSVTKRVVTTEKTVTTSAPELLPIITIGDSEGTNPARPKFNWTEPSGGPIDGYTLAAFGSGGGSNLSWGIIVPPEFTSFTVPAMPSDIPIDGVFLDRIVGAEATFVAGYDQFRSYGAALVNTGLSGTSELGVIHTTIAFVPR